MYELACNQGLGCLYLTTFSSSSSCSLCCLIFKLVNQIGPYFKNINIFQAMDQHVKNHPWYQLLYLCSQKSLLYLK